MMAFATKRGEKNYPRSSNEVQNQLNQKGDDMPFLPDDLSSLQSCVVVPKARR
jgi:hypothetical protein